MNRKPYNKLNKNDFDNIIKIYYDKNNINKSFEQMSVIADVSERAFSRVLVEHGINTRLKNRYVINNELYFDNINTEDKAYFIGLLFADGYVGNNNEIVITLKNIGNTKEILTKLVDDIESNIKIKHIEHIATGFETDSTFLKLSFSNIHINKTLKNIGLGSHKENTRQCIPCQIISNNLERHLIRGLYDGDGCISVKNKHMKTPQKTISFMGNKTLLLEVQNILETKLLLNHTAIRESFNSSKISELRYGGNRQVNKIKEYLYTDAHVYLSHKQI